MSWNPFIKPVTQPAVTQITAGAALSSLNNIATNGTTPYHSYIFNGSGGYIGSPPTHTSKREDLLNSIKYQEQHLLSTKEALEKNKAQLEEFQQYDENLHELLNTILKTHIEAPGAESELKCLKILQNYVDKIAYENQLEKLGNS